jgi:predicted peroxiredoxin
MRGKTITTSIAYAAARGLAELAEGETLELLTDAGDAIDNDIRAWCRATGQELAARAGLAKAGHIPAREKIGQLQAPGARLYICGPPMQHFNVATTDLAFDDVTIAEYLTFMEIMANADIHVFVQ